MRQPNIDDSVYMHLAEVIMFQQDRGYSAIEKQMDSLGLEFRKGKSFKDIELALKKSLNVKTTFGKVEYELSMLQVYLKKDIVKRKR